ncbi:hypothetical protein Tco_1502747 [Tanacetum coccineum]
MWEGSLCFLLQGAALYSNKIVGLKLLDAMGEKNVRDVGNTLLKSYVWGCEGFKLVVLVRSERSWIKCIRSNLASDLTVYKHLIEISVMREFYLEAARCGSGVGGRLGEALSSSALLGRFPQYLVPYSDWAYTMLGLNILIGREEDSVLFGQMDSVRWYCRHGNEGAVIEGGESCLTERKMVYAVLDEVWGLGSRCIEALIRGSGEMTRVRSVGSLFVMYELFRVWGSQSADIKRYSVNANSLVCSSRFIVQMAQMSSGSQKRLLMCMSKKTGKAKISKERKKLGSPSIGYQEAAIKKAAELEAKAEEEPAKKKANEEEHIKQAAEEPAIKKVTKKGIKAAKAEAKKKEAKKAAKAKSDKEQTIKKASKGKNNVDETADVNQTDNQEDIEEIDDVEQVLKKIPTISFLNTSTRSKKKEADKVVESLLDMQKEARKKKREQQLEKKRKIEAENKEKQEQDKKRKEE